MSEKTLKTRIQNKRGTTAEWAAGTAPNFIPLDGELVIYKDVNKIKIGNGTSKVGDLPFVAANGLDALEYTFTGEVVSSVPSQYSSITITNSRFNRTPVAGDSVWVPLRVAAESAPSYAALCNASSIGANQTSFTVVTAPTKIKGTDGKVKDVTLDGESIVNADGVVELHPTAMTDGYVPVWNNTTKVFEDGIKKTNIVTLDTDQSIGGHKTFDTGFTTTARAIFNSSAEFNEDLILACPIMISNSAGTTGQVLTSQGPGNSPKWGDVPAPTNVVTTNTSQTISGSKTFSAVTTYTGGITNKRSSTGRFFDCYSSANGATASTIFGVYLNNAGTSSANPIGTVKIGSAGTQCAIKLAGSAGTSGQVIISQGDLKTPKWGDVVTIDTTQNITGTKTFSNIQITGDAFYQDARLFFTTADGAQQSLSMGDTLSTSTNTSFILPLINDDGVAYELGTALYCHCIIASGGNAVATFQVFCNRRTEFMSLSSLYSSIMSNQTATVVYIPATGTLHSSSFASAQIVEAVKFMNSKIYICTRYLSKAASSESIQATDINDISIYECNRTSR